MSAALLTRPGSTSSDKTTSEGADFMFPNTLDLLDWALRNAETDDERAEYRRVLGLLHGIDTAAQGVTL